MDLDKFNPDSIMKSPPPETEEQAAARRKKNLKNKRVRQQQRRDAAKKKLKKQTNTPTTTTKTTSAADDDAAENNNDDEENLSVASSSPSTAIRPPAARATQQEPATTGGDGDDDDDDDSSVGSHSVTTTSYKKKTKTKAPPPPPPPAAFSSSKRPPRASKKRAPPASTTNASTTDDASVQSSLFGSVGGGGPFGAAAGVAFAPTGTWPPGASTPRRGGATHNDGGSVASGASYRSGADTPMGNGHQSDLLDGDAFTLWESQQAKHHEFFMSNTAALREAAAKKAQALERNLAVSHQTTKELTGVWDNLHYALVQNREKYVETGLASARQHAETMSSRKQERREEASTNDMEYFSTRMVSVPTPMKAPDGPDTVHAEEEDRKPSAIVANSSVRKRLPLSTLETVEEEETDIENNAVKPISKLALVLDKTSSAADDDESSSIKPTRLLSFDKEIKKIVLIETTTINSPISTVGKAIAFDNNGLIYSFDLAGTDGEDDDEGSFPAGTGEDDDALAPPGTREDADGLVPAGNGEDDDGGLAPAGNGEGDRKGEDGSVCSNNAGRPSMLADFSNQVWRTLVGKGQDSDLSPDKSVYMSPKSSKGEADSLSEASSFYSLPDADKESPNKDSSPLPDADKESPNTDSPPLPDTDKESPNMDSSPLPDADKASPNTDSSPKSEIAFTSTPTALYMISLPEDSGLVVDITAFGEHAFVRTDKGYGFKLFLNEESIVVVAELAKGLEDVTSISPGGTFVVVQHGPDPKKQMLQWIDLKSGKGTSVKTPLSHMVRALECGQDHLLLHTIKMGKVPEVRSMKIHCVADEKPPPCLGRGGTKIDQLKVVTSLDTLAGKKETKVSRISASKHHTMALFENGELIVFGKYLGELYFCKQEQCGVWYRPFRHIIAGDEFALAMCEDRKLWMLGEPDVANEVDLVVNGTKLVVLRTAIAANQACLLVTPQGGGEVEK